MTFSELLESNKIPYPEYIDDDIRQRAQKRCHRQGAHWGYVCGASEQKSIDVEKEKEIIAKSFLYFSRTYNLHETMYNFHKYLNAIGFKLNDAGEDMLKEELDKMLEAIG